MRDALALIDDAHSAEDPEAFAERVVEGLARLVPGEVVGYNEREVVSHRLLAACELPSTDPPPEVVDAVSTFCGEYPLSMMRRRSDPRALKISDFLSTRELHRLDYYNHALRPLGIEHQIRIWLSAPPGIARYFYVGRRRADGDFGARDRDLLELVRPFLVALRKRFDADLGYEGGWALPHRPRGRDPCLGRSRHDEPGDRSASPRVTAHRPNAPRARIQEAASPYPDRRCRSRLRNHELALGPRCRGANPPPMPACRRRLTNVAGEGDPIVVVMLRTPAAADFDRVEAAGIEPAQDSSRRAQGRPPRPRRAASESTLGQRRSCL